MSFGGSVAAMINSLKNNTRMLRGRSYMHKDDLQSFKRGKGLNFVKGTPEEIARIRKTVVQQRKIRRKRILIAFGSFIFILLTTLVLLLKGII